ncbi:MAG: peptidoglycan-associated lipoprotein Pal [Elusimicrobiales bacterium]
MKIRILIPVMAAAALMSACAGKSVKSLPAQADKAETVASLPVAGAVPAVPGASEADIQEASVPEGSLRGGDFASDPSLGTVYFDYDRYAISDSTRGTLEKNADALKSKKGNDILVEGHCDERGTVEYNIALGQKRAREVREYYIRLGVDGGKVATISYGEERPVCPDHNETCWAKNRRAETKLRGGKTSS